MKIGTTDIKDIFLGTIEVKKIFSGTTLLYEKSLLPTRYVQTTTADFSGTGTSVIADYTGTAEYIILPEDMPDGYAIYRIRNLNVKGVATSGDYLTTANQMFNGNNSLYLELDYLNTSNATSMSQMFYNSKATTLDLSNFDTSKVINMSSMFRNSQATTGYARTQTDANNFNSRSYKPSTLTFVDK